MVASGIGLLLLGTRKSHLRLEGKILKVRTYPLEDRATAVVADFRVHNPSEVLFVVRDLEAELETADGKRIEAGIFAEIDAERLFRYYPLIGQKYNPTLVARDRIKPGETLDRMVALRVDLPESEVQARRNLRIRIIDVDRIARPVIAER